MEDAKLSEVVKEFCLRCSGGSERAVLWCPDHGACYAACLLWRYRFGVQPEAFRAEYGPRLLTPGAMPHPKVDVALLPGTLDEASTAEINIPADPVTKAPAYRQPAVTMPATGGTSQQTRI